MMDDRQDLNRRAARAAAAGVTPFPVGMSKTVNLPAGIKEAAMTDERQDLNRRAARAAAAGVTPFPVGMSKTVNLPAGIKEAVEQCAPGLYADAAGINLGGHEP